VTLFSITARNIKKNFQNYFLYFFSMVFSIVVFYIFTSIQYNDQVAQIIGERTRFMLNVGSISVRFFQPSLWGIPIRFLPGKGKRS
jgi:putative ABC transport system permease protein